MYFPSERPGGKGLWDIYRVRFESGSYTRAENLGEAINTEFYDGSPYIAPDESYLIFSSVSRPDGHRGSDLYISFRKADDEWSRAVNMGGAINTKEHEAYPIVSPDRKYLFFFREGDIYWVDIRITEKLGPNKSVQNKKPQTLRQPGIAHPPLPSTRYHRDRLHDYLLPEYPIATYHYRTGIESMAG